MGEGHFNTVKYNFSNEGVYVFNTVPGNLRPQEAEYHPCKNLITFYRERFLKEKV
jgi:hypothetical protein